jgi:hypothetical protein
MWRLDADDEGFKEQIPIPDQGPLCSVFVLELQVQEVGIGRLTI